MTLSITVPDELYRKAAEIAEAEHVSVEQVISLAVAEQLAAWERLKGRAARGSRDRFLAVLDKAPDVEPDESDRTV